MLFVRYKFRHIEHRNTTLCTHFSNLSLVRVRHSLMTRQNDASLWRKLLRCAICGPKLALRTRAPGTMSAVIKPSSKIVMGSVAPVYRTNYFLHIEALFLLLTTMDGGITAPVVVTSFACVEATIADKLAGLAPRINEPSVRSLSPELPSRYEKFFAEERRAIKRRPLRSVRGRAGKFHKNDRSVNRAM